MNARCVGGGDRPRVGVCRARTPGIRSGVAEGERATAGAGVRFGSSHGFAPSRPAAPRSPFLRLADRRSRCGLGWRDGCGRARGFGGGHHFRSPQLSARSALVHFAHGNPGQGFDLRRISGCRPILRGRLRPDFQTKSEGLEFYSRGREESPGIAEILRGPARNSSPTAARRPRPCNRVVRSVRRSQALAGQWTYRPDAAVPRDGHQLEERRRGPARRCGGRCRAVQAGREHFRPLSLGAPLYLELIRLRRPA